MTQVQPTPRRDPLPDNAPHILVVDDDQRIRELIARAKEGGGFQRYLWPKP